VEIIALAIAPIAAGLAAAGLRTDFAQSLTPALFFLTVAALGLTYVGSVQGSLLCLVAASVGAGMAGAGLVATVLTIDARLARKGTANAGPTALRPSLAIGGARRWREFEQGFWALVDGDEQGPSEEALYSLQRQGRAALLIFLKRDSSGRLLDAAAFDPEDYA
jgi:hypothetical protein